MCTTEDRNLAILHDIRNEKEVNWRLRRLITLRLAKAYERLESPKYSRIIDCAGYMEFKRFEDNSLKLKTANFCQLRLCPMCSFRRSKKIFAQVSRIMGAIENDYKFVFLTLTCKNVVSADLEKQINNVFTAYKTLCLRKRFKEAVRGAIKCFEVTHNWNTMQFHPHLHIVLAVDKDYFTSELYINQNEFCELWQSCLKVDYKPIVDVRTFTESEKGKGKEVAEVAKYTVKASHVLADLREITSYSKEIKDEAERITNAITDEIVLTLDSALKNRRLVSYSGIFKKKHKELNLNDDDLIHTEVDSVESDLSYEIERYVWNPILRNYFRLEDRITENDEKSE